MEDMLLSEFRLRGNSVPTAVCRLYGFENAELSPTSSRVKVMSEVKHVETGSARGSRLRDECNRTLDRTDSRLRCSAHDATAISCYSASLISSLYLAAIYPHT